LYLKDFGYFGAAYGNTNISSYTDATTPIGATLKDAAAKAKAFGENPNSTMIGANIDVLRDAWQASKDAGKTWQVWTGATVLAPKFLLRSFIAVKLYPLHCLQAFKRTVTESLERRQLDSFVLQWPCKSMVNLGTPMILEDLL
jgi:hypothetical protein